MRRSVTAHLTALAVSPDGQWLACADGNGISIWDPASGALSWRFEGHTKEVRSVAFSPDGSLVASGSLDGLIKVWSVMGEQAQSPASEPASPSGIFRRPAAAAQESPAEMVQFRCTCGSALRTGKQNAGKRTRCPHCGVALTVPGS
jgi:WD40 repeat protein